MENNNSGENTPNSSEFSESEAKYKKIIQIPGYRKVDLKQQSLPKILKNYLIIQILSI